MLYRVGDKLWGLPEVDKHPETVALALVKRLDRDGWSLRDIHEASQMIERLPVVKEVVLELISMIEPYNPNEIGYGALRLSRIRGIPVATISSILSETRRSINDN